MLAGELWEVNTHLKVAEVEKHCGKLCVWPKGKSRKFCPVIVAKSEADGCFRKQMHRLDGALSSLEQVGGPDPAWNWSFATTCSQRAQKRDVTTTLEWGNGWLGCPLLFHPGFLLQPLTMSLPSLLRFYGEEDATRGAEWPGRLFPPMSLVDLGKKLLEAAREGQEDEVRLLMASGAPFTTDWLGTSPLHLAAQYGHYSTAEVLLRAGMSRDARTKVDRTPLHMAAADGHRHIVELLVRNGADVNARDMLKMTALHWATERNHRDIIELLLECGADVHAFSKFNKSAFDIALDKNNPETLLLLQEAMQNQVDPERAHGIPSSVTVGQPFVLASGELLSLASLVSSADAKAASGDSTVSMEQFPNSTTSFLATLAAIAEASAPLSSASQIPAVSEEIVETHPADASLQQAASGGQHFLAIVTEGVPLGHLQTALPAACLGQQFIITMPNGQQILTVPAGQDAEGRTLRAPSEDHHASGAEKPPPKRVKDGCEQEALRQRLQAATHEAQEFRSQLLKKEREAELCRQKLEAMGQREAGMRKGAAPEGVGTATGLSEETGGSPG